MNNLPSEAENEDGQVDRLKEELRFKQQLEDEGPLEKESLFGRYPNIKYHTMLTNKGTR